MSSHHIIREKQEPALLVLGLDNFTDELLGQLLEWSPSVLVSTDTADELNSLGIKFDILISDDDTYLQEDIKHVPIKGDDVVTAALKYLVANGYPAVNVVTDGLQLENYLPCAGQINIVLFNAGKKIFPVKSGFTKWKPAGEVVEVMSTVTDLEYSGLDAIGESQYQTTKDGLLTLRFAEPLIFIAESIV